jgi:type VII secretion integral membrane protein EccD
MTIADGCRVAVQVHGHGRSSAVDLALPNQLKLGEMLPCLVELVDERPIEADGGAFERWRLSRFDGSHLDESVTLPENGVRDGDVLMLTVEAPTTTPRFMDSVRYVASASAVADTDSGWSRRMAAFAFLWSAGCGATILAWPGHASATNRAVIAVIVAIASTAAAIVAERVEGESQSSLTLGVTAAAFGAVAGYLMVPGGPAPPNFVLAAAICSAASATLLHLSSCGSTSYTAIATFSVMTAIGAAAAAMWPVPRVTVGALLAAASVAMLSCAAKLSILLSGLSPRMPSAIDEHGDDETVPADVGAYRAECGHRTLTGLLAGLAFSAASGAVLVAAGPHRYSGWSGIAFTGVVSLVLISRACQQRGAARSTAILVAALVSITAALMLVTFAVPSHAPSVCLIVIGLGAGALCLARADLGSGLSPFARRSIDVVDYVAIAAVVPLACWVGDVFGFVRGLSLT